VLAVSRAGVARFFYLRYHKRNFILRYRKMEFCEEVQMHASGFVGHQTCVAPSIKVRKPGKRRCWFTRGKGKKNSKEIGGQSVGEIS